jgi:hypothetical protein
MLPLRLQQTPLQMLLFVMPISSTVNDPSLMAALKLNIAKNTTKISNLKESVDIDGKGHL